MLMSGEPCPSRWSRRTFVRELCLSLSGLRLSHLLLGALIGLSACVDHDADLIARVGRVDATTICVVPVDPDEGVLAACYPIDGSAPQVAVGSCIKARFPEGRTGPRPGESLQKIRVLDPKDCDE